MYLLRFWTWEHLLEHLELLSMEGLIALRFHQKHLNLCSEDEGLTGLERHEGE